MFYLLISLVLNFILFVYFLISVFDKKNTKEKEIKYKDEISIQKKSILKLNEEYNEFLESVFKLILEILKDHDSTVKFSKTLRISSFKGNARYDAIKMLYDHRYIKSASIEGENIVSKVEK